MRFLLLVLVLEEKNVFQLVALGCWGGVGVVLGWLLGCVVLVVGVSVARDYH